MKKIFLVCLITACSASIFATPSFALPDISQKILTSFKAHFPDYRNPTVFRMGDTYTVSYKDDDNKTSGRFYYDADGNLIQSMRYYGADELSPFIKEKIEAKYKGKSIYMVTDVESNSGHFYQVLLQNADKLLVVHVNSDGTMYTEKKFNKSA